MIRYDRLWATMEAQGMTQYRLIKHYNFSAGQIGRLKKNMHVSTHTLAQLNAAAHNEYEEHDVVYKSFGDIAQKEGFSQIAATFRMIAEIEKTHGERFQYLADLLGAGNLYVSPQKETWICTNCGYIYEGEEPPQYCPVCHHDQGYFARKELAPWYLQDNMQKNKQAK